MSKENEQIKEKATRLFQYLKELSILRSKVIRDVTQYPHVLWLGDIPEEPECFTHLSGFDEKREDVWLEIKKPVIPELPHLPSELVDWVNEDNLNNAVVQPHLLEKKLKFISNNQDFIDGEDQYEFLTEHPEIEALWEKYLEKWLAWSKEFIRTQKVQQVYSGLFEIYQEQKRLGEEYELVLGLGLLNWKTPNGQRIHRHLLVGLSNLVLNADSGTLTLSASVEGAKPTVEQDMLEISERVDEDILQELDPKLQDLNGNFWNRDAAESILRSSVQAISPDGRYLETDERRNEISSSPTVSFSPALILRKRNQKSFLQAFESIKNQIEETTMTVPLGIRRIIETIDDKNKFTSQSGELGTTAEKAQIYFPLEANEEQRKIIQNLVSRNGVIVQGPPGTGKSHTIANLISHLLATGQRVLVTSQTPRALKVLKDKVPEELQSLCVSLLGEDRNALRDLESVVQGISNKKDLWDAEESEQRIGSLESKLESLKKQRAIAWSDIRANREKETFVQHLLDGKYSGTAQSIAEKVYDEFNLYGWMNDKIDFNVEVPLTNGEALELSQLLYELNNEIIEEINLSYPSYTELPLPEIFANNILNEQDLITKIKPLLVYKGNLNYNTLKALSKEDRSNGKQKLKKYIEQLTFLERYKDKWVSEAIKDIHDNQYSSWNEFYQFISSELDGLLDRARGADQHVVDIQDQYNRLHVLSDARDLYEHFEKGKGLGIPLLRTKVVKKGMYITKEIRVDGKLCNQKESLGLLIDILDVDEHLNRICLMISQKLGFDKNQGEMRSLIVADLTKLLTQLQDVNLLKDYSDVIKNDILSPFNIQLENILKADIEGLIHTIDIIDLEEDLNHIQGQFLKIKQNLVSYQNIDTNSKHEVLGLINESLDSKNESLYRNAYEIVVKLDSFSQKSSRCDELMQRLRKTLPNLYSELMESHERENWHERMASFDKAFQWCQVRTWVERFMNIKLDQLFKKVDSLDSEIRQVIIELGSLKAWKECFKSLTEDQRQHLIAWTLATRRIGKGTGVNAEKHRRDAQYHMQYCRESIPAWIMPLYRVVESFNPKAELFDVVIIDEASQSGPEAIVLQYLAKKIIVVGDDKQISPENVGLDRNDVEMLRKRYIKDFPHSDLLGVDNSFFDLANVLFGGRIVLREHFRCMPEIIEFSNRISYPNTPLYPLRQYPPNRLEPIKTRHIIDGYREGKGQKVFNKPEAEAIVQTIIACCKDPKYNDKTFGVISLLNQGQAQLIESLLLQEIGPEEMEKRNLICGDAYAFQGDERDVIFLSLVAAPGEKQNRPLTTDKDRRRFNVGGSRAKDQLWLFHTLTTNDIRNKECMRYQLISYCQNPRKMIEDSNREKCESEFEKAVYDLIVKREYRVVPQVEVAGYRIDLVIEGEQGRIAVECDGDKWHGPDRYLADMTRQRMLERCGWTFWRVRGSSFYYNPEQAMDSLWTLLDEYGIRPNRGEREVISTGAPKDVVQDRIASNVAKEIVDQESVDLDIEIKNNDTKDLKMDQQLSFFDEEIKEVDYTSILESEFSVQPEMIVQYLLSKDCEIIDKRPKGGALWVIGGKELEDALKPLHDKGIRFQYSPNGGRATKKQPAWFTNWRE